MLRSMTSAQKHAREFYKCEALTQTNQINYDCFFFAYTENTKKLFSNLKVETKFPGTSF